MNRMWWAWVACAVALLLSACSGGDGMGETASLNTASDPIVASPGPLRVATPQVLASSQPFTALSLFEWAQQNFRQFFTGSSVDGVIGPFTVRFYPQTQTYLGVSTDGGVYVKGPQISGDQILFVAPLALMNCLASPGACPAMQAGASVVGNIAVAGDRDWHTISLTAGQAYSFSLEGSATGQGTLTDPLLRLFSSAGQQLTSDDDSGVSFNAAMVCAPSASGTYYVSAEGTTTDTGTYRLSVNAVPGAAVACESRPNDPGINWNSPVAAPAILAGTVTLGAQQRAGVNFDLTGAGAALESIFVSQGSADLFVMNSADLPACVAGGSFNFIAEASFQGETGFRSFALPAGSYAICARNQTSAPNAISLKLQNLAAAPGFHFSRQQFAPVAQSVAAGARFVKAVNAADVYRMFIEGANTGGTFYIIPPEQTANFLAGQPFEHYPQLTTACGGLGAAGTAAPVLCELPGVVGQVSTQYNIAYFNDTASAQSIVVTGREYVPD
jgi:hypothetical protein